jgi:methylated-DNA-[protein]-cysteine S-methyltransferase
MSLKSVLYKSNTVGDLVLIASTKGLRALLWKNADNSKHLKSYHINDKTLLSPPDTASHLESISKQYPVLKQATEQLDEYFEGKRRTFSVPLDIDTIGTPFQQKVWKILTEIPFADVITYSQEAEKV